MSTPCYQYFSPHALLDAIVKSILEQCHVEHCGRSDKLGFKIWTPQTTSLCYAGTIYCDQACVLVDETAGRKQVNSRKYWSQPPKRAQKLRGEAEANWLGSTKLESLGISDLASV